MGVSEMATQAVILLCINHAAEEAQNSCMEGVQVGGAQAFPGS